VSEGGTKLPRRIAWSYLPKSMSLICPETNIKLAGLISECTIPVICRERNLSVLLID